MTLPLPENQREKKRRATEKRGKKRGRWSWVMVSSAILVQAFEEWWTDEERLWKWLLFPSLLLHPGWLLVKSNRLCSWPPSGHPGRFTPCGRDGAMACLAQWLAAFVRGGGCHSWSVCFATVYQINILNLERWLFIPMRVSLHILFTCASLISILEMQLIYEVSLLISKKFSRVSR